MPHVTVCRSGTRQQESFRSGRRHGGDLSGRQRLIEADYGSSESFNCILLLLLLQTLARGEYLRLTKFDPSRFKAVIIDEVRATAQALLISVSLR